MYGRYMGFVTYNGEVFNRNNLVGKMRSDGLIVNDQGEVVGESFDITSETL